MPDPAPTPMLVSFKGFSSERKKLKSSGLSKSGRASAFSGWAGGLFFSVGFALILMAAGVVPAPFFFDEPAAWTELRRMGLPPPPPWKLGETGRIVGAIGMILLAIGIVLLEQFISGLRKDKQRRVAVDPVLRDYPWNTGMAEMGIGRDIWVSATVTVLLFLFVLLIEQVAQSEGRFLVRCIVAVFGLACLLGLGRAVLQCYHWWRFGHSRVEFIRFPYRRGETCHLRWIVPRGMARLKKAVYTLRCVEEFERKEGESIEIVHEEVLCGTWECERPSDVIPGSVVDLRCDLPASASPTHLSGEPVSFWELEVVVHLSGPAFKAHYLVPVY